MKADGSNRALETRSGAPARVEGEINYCGPMTLRPRFHANDASLDVLALETRCVEVTDARRSSPAPSLEREGFALVAHTSAVAAPDVLDRSETDHAHRAEIERLVTELTGADRVVVGSPGVLRFGERSTESGRRSNSRPARFVHIDVSDATAAAFAEGARPEDDERRIRRYAHYNVWRVLTAPPQDVPLAVCDARSVASEDRVEADAVFDERDRPWWTFEALVVRHNPVHRWFYYSDMTPGEVIVFKTNDSDPSRPSQVPHSAFDDPTCPAGVQPRASIEMRAIAYWLD